MTGPLAGLDYGFVAFFGLAAILAVFATVMVSAFLPRDTGPVAGHGSVGATLVWSVTAATLLLVAALVYAASLLPVSVAIVVVGLAVLGAPFLVEPIPRDIRESRLALGVLLMLVAICLLALSAFRLT